MNCVCVVVTFEGSLKGPAFLIDFGVTRIQIFIGRTYGHILVPVVLNSRADADLPVQGQIGCAGVLISGQGVN